ncbi:unnamed protein product [Closterium sp. NIES-54]
MATITSVAAARGGQRQSLPLPDDPTPQQLREWVLQRARPGGGGFGFLRTAQRRQQSQQETFSPQVLSELFPQRCVTGSVEAAALGASESVAALGASESAAALGASESAAQGQFSPPHRASSALPTGPVQPSPQGQFSPPHRASSALPTGPVQPSPQDQFSPSHRANSALPTGPIQPSQQA